jgi:hypothetical protein
MDEQKGPAAYPVQVAHRTAVFSVSKPWEMQPSILHIPSDDKLPLWMNENSNLWEKEDLPACFAASRALFWTARTPQFCGRSTHLVSAEFGSNKRWTISVVLVYT